MTMAGESSAEAERTVETLRAKIEYLRQEAGERRERFEALEEEQLRRKVRGQTAQSPFFFAQSWGSAAPGGSTSYTAYVHNPDPGGYSGFWLFGYLFFGPANFISDTNLALASKIDERFPYSYQRLSIAAGSDASATFTVGVGSTVAPGIYLGNCFLVLRDSFDVGTYFDRAAFDLTVT
jgi:hypothetical protein